MPNPTISFRLNKYQLARGIDIILRSIPDYKPSSISNIVKICYLDYLAKMSKDISLAVSKEASDKIKNITKSSNPLDDVLAQMQTNQFDKTRQTTKIPLTAVDDFFDDLKDY